MQMNLNDPREFTLERMREMIASADEELNVQLRVSHSGVAHFAQLMSPPDYSDSYVAFESFAAGNDYHGVEASQDATYVKELYDLLKRNWPCVSRADTPSIVHAAPGAYSE
jgi:hypothetical protein